MDNKEFINRIVERSLISIGNNYRIKTAMEKVRSGEKVTIVYFGASITSGFAIEKQECFAVKSYNYFLKKFGTGNNIIYINTGIPGTSSLFGLLRMERDVLAYEPDIVFLEFAVNDGKNDISRMSFEGLVARILTSKKQPAVVLLFAVSESGYTCQGQMKQIGIHYELPMISVKEGILPEINSNSMLWKDYFSDQAHPNKHGHSLIAEMIKNYFETVYKEDKDTMYQLPEEAFYGLQFQNMIMLDSSNIKLDTTGGFKATETIEMMKNGWVFQPRTSKENFLFKIKCRSLFVVYKESNNINTGTAEVYVDGKLQLSLNGYNSMGWDNPMIKPVFNERDAALHTIELKIPEYDEDKEFTILGFGYCDL